MLALVIVLCLPILLLGAAAACARRSLPILIACLAAYAGHASLGLWQAVIAALLSFTTATFVLDRAATSWARGPIIVLQALIALLVFGLFAYALLVSSGVHGWFVLAGVTLSSACGALCVLRVRLAI